MLKKIFLHTLIYGLAPHVSKIATIFIFPVLTANLTEIDYGVSGVILSYMGLFILFETLGLRLILVNTFYHHTNHFLKRWKFIYGILKIWMVIFALFYGLLLYFIIPEIASSNFLILLLLITIPKIFFGSERLIFSTYHQLNQNPYQIGVRSIILGFIGVFVTYYTIVELKMGYMGWFWATFITNIVGGFSYWLHLKFKLKISPIFTFKTKLIRKFLKVTLPTIPHNYSVFLLDASDRLVMDQTNVNTEDIGEYNFAYTFANYFSMISMALGIAVGPIMNQKLKQQKEIEFRTIIFALQLLFFNMTFIFCIWCKEIFSFLIDNETLASLYPLAIILVMSYNYRPQYLAVSLRLFYKEKTARIWRVSLLAGLINLVLNIILIPIFGFEIAALTTFISLLYMGYYGFLFSDYKEIKPKLKYYPLLWMISQIILTIITYFFCDADDVVKLFLCLIVFFPLVFYVIKNKSLLISNQIL